MSDQEKKLKKPNGNQRSMIRRRGLDPKNYVVLKETISSLYLKDVRSGTIKILAKLN